MNLGWHHIALTGDYNWYSGASEGINARPLNLYSVRIRAWQPRSVQAALALLSVILSTNLVMTPCGGDGLVVRGHVCARGGRCGGVRRRHDCFGLADVDGTGLRLMMNFPA